MIDYVLLEKYTHNISVLFVEDDELIRKEIVDLLSDIFSHVDIAVDGQEGINQYKNYYEDKKSHYDLVITDIKMPKVNGIELVKMIYAQHSNQPIIVLSAHDESKYLIELINMGISQFIQKPLEINSFIDIIFNISKDIYTQQTQQESIQSSIVQLNETSYWDRDLKQLSTNKQEVKLSKKELLILDCLLHTKDKVCTVDELLTYVWRDTPDTNPDIQNLNNIMARLRKKAPEVHIENIYGLGYKIKII